MARKVTVVPSAHRLMQSLRDIGYDLSTAVADLIDNSIAAGATVVRVDYEFEGEDTWIRIADDGSGMSPEAIDEALRFGTKRDYDDDALGKFGLGLKTASLSQCQKFTVASRVKGNRIAIRQWDLAHIEATDAWELLRLSPNECHPEVTAPLKRSHGTVVFWQRLDRVLGYAIPAGQAARTGFMQMCRQLEEHLAMVFHRYLSGEAKRKLPLQIFINGHTVEPWDPFCRSEAKIQTMKRRVIPFEHEGVKSAIRVQPYILPHESQFSTGQAFKQAGRGNWNALQGFYIYRNDRLLQAGGWSRVRALDEHVKLARVAVDFPPSADAAFKLNVAKMGISFPAEVRENLGRITREVSGRAQEVYRKKEKKSEPPKPPVVQKPGPTGTVTPPDRKPELKPDRRTPDPGTSQPDADSDERPATLVSLVLNILRRELEGEPQTLARLLDALTEVDPGFTRNVRKGTESA